MKFAYDATYFPPIPVLEISLARPESAPEIGPIQGIVDTAADGSLIPSSLLKSINAPVFDEVSVRSAFGEARKAHWFEVDLFIGEPCLPGIYVVGYQGTEIILGRDI